MPREGVTLTRIGVDCRAGFAGQCRLDLGLCRLGNKLILLGQMHQQRRMEAVHLAQILLSVPTVKDDRSIDAVAHGRQEDGPVARRSEERRVGKECRSRWSPY